MFCDFEKAYDRVDQEFMITALEAYGFGPYFVSVVVTMYSSTQCCIIVNMFITEPTPTTSGVKQGCPASSGLFVLVIELFGNLVRQSSIKGLVIHGHITNGCYFADDCLPILRDEEDYLTLEELVEIYDEATGAKFNVEKTGAMPIGAMQGEAKPVWVKMTWITGTEKLLGNEVGNTVSNEKAFERSIRNLNVAVNNWQVVQCSVHGRVIAHNQALIPKVFYVATTNVISPDVMKKIHSILWTEYLWQGKRAKINVLLASMSRDFGSLGVVDFETKVEASRIMTIKELVQSEGEWTNWVINELRNIQRRWKFHGCFLRDLSRHNKRITFDPNNFWEECFRVWAQAGGGQGLDGSVGMRDAEGKWVEIQNLTSKVVYNALIHKKTEKQRKRIEEKWQGWNIRASNRIVHENSTPPSIRQFFTSIRHGGLMVNARVAHIQYLGVSDSCAVCGERETQDHFFFECREAGLFWGQICTLFPSVRERTKKEMLMFKRSSIGEQAYAFQKDEKATDDVIAEAIFARWKERCKAAIRLKYVYQNVNVWTSWQDSLRVRFEDGDSSGRSPEDLRPMPTLPPRPQWWRALPQPPVESDAADAVLLPPMLLPEAVTELAVTVMPEERSDEMTVRVPAHSNFW